MVATDSQKEYNDGRCSAVRWWLDRPSMPVRSSLHIISYTTELRGNLPDTTALLKYAAIGSTYGVATAAESVPAADSSCCCSAWYSSHLGWTFRFLLSAPCAPKAGNTASK